MSGAQAMAGDYAGCVNNLEAIARFYVREDVRVRFQPAQHWLGLARRTENGPEILINPYAPAAQLGHILFHEVAHHVCWHVLVVNTQPAAELATDDTAARLERLTPPEAATWRAVIDAREGEADRWAHERLAAYERRFGPFLKAIR